MTDFASNYVHQSTDAIDPGVISTKTFFHNKVDIFPVFCFLPLSLSVLYSIFVCYKVRKLGSKNWKTNKNKVLMKLTLMFNIKAQKKSFQA